MPEGLWCRGQQSQESVVVVLQFTWEFSGHIPHHSTFVSQSGSKLLCRVPGGEGCASCVRDEANLYLMPDSSVLACPLAR